MGHYYSKERKKERKKEINKEIKKERKKERKKTHLLAFKQWRKWTKGQLLTKCFFSFLKVPKGQHFFLEMGRCNFS